LVHPDDDQFIERLDKMVAAGRITKEEAERLRSAEPSMRDDIVREIRLRHARAKLGPAVEDGRVTQAEADDIVGHVASGERPRFLGHLRRGAEGGRSIPGIPVADPSLGLPHTSLARPGRGQPGDFDFHYAVTPPWDIGRPQPAFVALAEAGGVRGRVLDIGCGTGEHALLAAGIGLDATGIDMAEAAIEAAKRKARDRGLKARFLVRDAFDLAALGEQFDTVLDSGLFHIFHDEDRPAFVESLRAVIPAGGRYFMLAFSDRQPGDWGPRRVSQDEIRASFSDGWQIDSIESARFEVTVDSTGQLHLPTPQGGVGVVEVGARDGVHAWLALVTRM
jgi:SAM-dependent methyltransferase